jgi:hypothetical protein
MYVLCQPRKIQTGRDKNGKAVLEQRYPGDPCPEAATWPNVQAWINKGVIKPVDGAPTYQAQKKRPAPMVAAGPEDIKRGLPASAPAPVAGQPLPGYQGLGSMKAAEVEPEAEAPAEDEEISPEVQAAVEELRAKSKDELLEVADSLELGLPKRTSKSDLIAAILDAALEAED